MKYFICKLLGETNRTGNCLMAIPLEHSERIIPANRVQTAVYERENGKAYISIPALLQLKDQSIHHEIILKSNAVLLLPRIDVEQEIPEEEIQQLPKAIGEMFSYFRGLYFGLNMVLILEPEKLKGNFE